jgi:LysM repeat protein
MLKIGSAVHTAHGPGTVTDTETTRGRTQYKVAGQGFSVWIDETKIAASEDSSEGEEPDYEGYRQELLEQPEDTRKTWLTRTRAGALGDVDESMSTTLPYDYEPQHPTEMYEEDQTITPDHDVDLEERMTPTNSVTGESEEGGPYPGPAPHLFATSSRESAESGCEECGEQLTQESDGTWGHVDEYGDPIPAMHQAIPFREGSLRTARPGSMNHYVQWAQQAGLQPDQDATANLYGKTHGVDGYGLLDKFNQRGASIHTAYPGKHRKAPEPEMLLPNEVEVWDDEDWLAAHPAPKFDDPREQKRYEEYVKKHVGDEELFDRALHNYEPIYVTAGSDDDQAFLDEGCYTHGCDFGEDDGEEHCEWCHSPNRRHSSVERPAGLSDKYIDLPIHRAAANDPLNQFRTDPVTFIQRTAYIIESATGLDPRVGQYMDLVEADPMIREAAWSDVRTKAMRLKTSGAVTVKDMAPNRIMASVVGDNGTYDVVIFKGASLTGSNSIDQWHCGCEWGKWAFRRKKTFVGRLCSHGLAAYFTMQSAHQTGRPRQQKLPKKNKPRRSLPVVSPSSRSRHSQKLAYDEHLLGPDGKLPYETFLRVHNIAPDHPKAKDWYQQEINAKPEAAQSEFPNAESYWASLPKPGASARGEMLPESAYDRFLSRGGRVLEDYKSWVSDVNMGVVDLPSADAFMSQLDDEPTSEDAKKVYDYIYDNFTERPQRNYDVDGYTFDPNEVWEGGNGHDNPTLRSQGKPDRLSPDLYRIPDPADPTSIDVEKDERKTTGPDQITAGVATNQFLEWADHHGIDPEDPMTAKIWAQVMKDQAQGNKRPGWTDAWQEKAAKVDKSWAKNHGKLDDEDTPIVRFSMRKEALTYTADENLLKKLRDLSAEPAAENFGNMAERNHEVSEIVSELRDRGYDASLFVAMRRTAEKPDPVGDLFDWIGQSTRSPFERDNGNGFLTENFDLRNPFYNDDAPTRLNPTGSGDYNNKPKDAPDAPSSPTGSSDPDAFKDLGGGSPEVKNTATETPVGTGGGGAAGGGGGGSDWSPNGNKDAIGAGDYKIQSGDTLTSISERSGVGIDDLMGGNSQITNKDLIFADDTLKIPGAPAATADSPDTGTQPPPVEPGGSAPTSGTPGVPPAPGPAPADGISDYAPDPGPPNSTSFSMPPTPSAGLENTAIPGTGGQPLGNPGLTQFQGSRHFFADEDEDLGALSGAGEPQQPAAQQPAVPVQQPQQQAPTGPPSSGVDPLPQITTDNFNNRSQPQQPVQSDGGKKLEEDLPQNANSTSGVGSGLDGDFFLNNVMPILQDVGGAVLPMVTQTLGPIASGIGSAIGNGISGLLTAGVVADGDDSQLSNFNDDSSAVDPAFAGSGPSRKDWFSTSEEWDNHHDYIDLLDEPESDLINYKVQPKQAAYDDGSDIVRQFQANIGNTALGGGAISGGGYSDDAIANAAQGFLRTAGRVYSLAEQQELMDEAHPQGARNLPGLDLRGTHYLEG